MALSQSDLAALQALGNTMGQYDWTGLLGAVTLGTPAAGTPTLQAGEDVGLVNGKPTLNAIKLYLDSLSNLQGPRNAFRQEAVKNGLDATGLSKSVGAIAGKFELPQFQAPQAQGFDMNSLWAKNRGLAPEMVQQYTRDTGQMPVGGVDAASPFGQWAASKGFLNNGQFTYSGQTPGGATVTQGPQGPSYTPTAPTAPAMAA